MTWFQVLHYELVRVCVDGLHFASCSLVWVWRG